ncbi:unnamed protein product [Nezara viridula]|uniref:Major facilitator superfamily (MFS) profile domain-containing protein n=1 Tax=Nezara viridula TaxID=85310 RepID=A0A9P0E687_NEZVI|nr:unnamed protein product [Nezara viridula]
MKLENIVPIPPDGGWGWVIVVVCFYANAVIDVPSIGFQVILPHLMDTLEVTASTASVIFSTYTLLLYFMGPFAGGICNRFGFKVTTVVGSLLMMIGLFVSFFMSDFVAFIIFFGIISGFGSSLVFMVGNVAPGFWFEFKRAIALGIASSATGFAVFSVILTAHVKESFGWKWCFIFWAACVALLCILAFLLKTPPMVELEASKMTHLENQKNVTALDVTRTGTKSLRPIRKKRTSEGEMADEKLQKIADTCGIPLKGPLRAPSRYVEQEEDSTNAGCARCWRCFTCQGSHEVGARPLYKQDIFYHGSVHHIAKIEGMPKDTYGLSVYNLPTETDVKQEMECHCKVPEAIVRAINEMVDFSLFKSAVFLFIVVASLLTYTAIYIPFLLIKKVNLEKMEESNASMLTTIMGLGSTVGRSTIGFLLYFFPKIKALQVLIVFSILGGLVICCVPLNYSFPYQITVSFLGGALPAVITPLRSVVIIEMMGLKKLTSASGILFFVQGIGCFIGMPIAELLNERSGTKYVGLIFSGVCYVLVGFSFIGVALIAILKG